MIFIPYERFVIETSLDVEEAVEVLSGVVQPNRFRRNPSSVNRKHYVGTVSKERFRFIRNVSYLNSFLPTIKGTFDSSSRVTRIVITMAGNPCVVISMTAVFAFFGYFLLSVLMGLFPGLLVISGSLVIGILGYAIYTLLFKAESNSDRLFLTKLFS
jgi:hypothetical protein